MIPHADTCTCHDCIRIAAFGALRILAAHARKFDTAARSARYNQLYPAADIFDGYAAGFRETIRAAMKSGKMPG